MLGAFQAVLLGTAGSAAASTGEYITTPEAHGWSAGNTELQNTAAFQAAIDEASANAAVPARAAAWSSWFRARPTRFV